MPSPLTCRPLMPHAAPPWSPLPPPRRGQPAESCPVLPRAPGGPLPSRGHHGSDADCSLPSLRLCLLPQRVGQGARAQVPGGHIADVLSGAFSTSVVLIVGICSSSSTAVHHPDRHLPTEPASSLAGTLRGHDVRPLLSELHPPCKYFIGDFCI